MLAVVAILMVGIEKEIVVNLIKISWLSRLVDFQPYFRGLSESFENVISFSDELVNGRLRIALIVA